MNGMLFFIAPVVSSFIGWLTNYLAVKMLFHPRKPITFLSVTIQGIFPKRQKELAANLAMMIQDNLISTKDVSAVITSPEFAERFKAMLQEGIETFIQEKLVGLHPMVAMFLHDEMMEKVRGLLVTQLNEIVPGLLARGAQEVEDRFDVAALVRDKIEGFSMDQLELLLFSIMKQEFRFIELVGAVLGFVIGVVQSLLFLIGGSL